MEATLCVAWSPHDHFKLISGGFDKKIVRWNLEYGYRPLSMPGHTNSVWCVAWSPTDRTTVASSGRDGLRVWNLEEGVSRKFSGHSGAVMTVSWSPHDASRLVSGGNDEKVIVWDVEKEAPSYFNGHTGIITSVAWDPHDKSFVASGSRDNNVILWDTEGNGAPFRVLEGHADGVNVVAWSPHTENLLASGSFDHYVFIWHVGGDADPERLDAQVAVFSISWNPSDPDCLVAGVADGRALLWNVASGELMDEIEVFNASERQVRCVSFSPWWKDRVVCVGSDECLHFWDIHTGETYQRSRTDASPPPLPPCEDAGEAKKPVDVEATPGENLREEGPPELNWNVEAVPKIDDHMEVSRYEPAMDKHKAGTAIAKGEALACPKGKAVATPSKGPPPKLAEDKEKEVQMAQRRVAELEMQLESAHKLMATLKRGGAVVDMLSAKDLLLEQSREILAGEEAEIDADQQLGDDATVLQSLIAANQTIQKKSSALQALRGILAGTVIAEGKALAGPNGKAVATPSQGPPPKLAENKEAELQMAQRRVAELEMQLESAHKLMATLKGGGAVVEKLVAMHLLLEQSREILTGEEAEIDADQQLGDDATVLQSLIAANQTIQKKNSALQALRGILPPEQPWVE